MIIVLCQDVRDWASSPLSSPKDLNIILHRAEKDLEAESDSIVQLLGLSLRRGASTSSTISYKSGTAPTRSGPASVIGGRTPV